MCLRFILLCFLLILLVLMLFSVSNCFVCYFRLLSLRWGKTDWIQFTPVIAFNKTDYLLVWKLVEYSFNHQTYLRKGVRCERNKQTGNASQDWYKIRSCWNNLFRDKHFSYLHGIATSEGQSLTTLFSTKMRGE